MVAVRLGIAFDQVTIFVCQHLPKVEEVAIFFQCNGGKFVVNVAQAVAVQPCVVCLCAHLRPYRRDRLHIDLCIRQCLTDHIQHQAVVGQKTGVISVPPQHVAAQQYIDGLGLLRGQSVQRDLRHAVCPLAAGTVDKGVGAYPLISAELRPGQTGIVDLQALRQAVAHKTDLCKPAFFHRSAGRQRRHAEVQRGLGAVPQRLHPELPRQRIADRVPCVVRGHLPQNGVLAQGGVHALPVQHLPQDANSAQQSHQRQKGNDNKHSAPAPVQDAPPVFLIICHCRPPTSGPGYGLFYL